MLKGQSRHLGDEMVRYAIAGAISAVVENSGFALWYYVAELGTVPSTLLGHAVAIMVNYVLNAFWVFRYRRVTKVSHEFAWFLAIALVGMGVNVTVMQVAEQWLDLTGIWAKVPASACVAGWALGAKKFWLFTQPAHERAMLEPLSPLPPLRPLKPLEPLEPLDRPHVE